MILHLLSTEQEEERGAETERAIGRRTGSGLGWRFLIRLIVGRRNIQVGLKSSMERFEGKDHREEKENKHLENDREKNLHFTGIKCQWLHVDSVV